MNIKYRYFKYAMSWQGYTRVVSPMLAWYITHDGKRRHDKFRGGFTMTVNAAQAARFIRRCEEHGIKAPLQVRAAAALGGEVYALCARLPHERRGTWSLQE